MGRPGINHRRYRSQFAISQAAYANCDLKSSHYCALTLTLSQKEKELEQSYRLRGASRSASGMVRALMPTIASPRSLETSARILGSL